MKSPSPTIWAWQRCKAVGRKKVTDLNNYRGVCRAASPWSDNYLSHLINTTFMERRTGFWMSFLWPIKPRKVPGCLIPHGPKPLPLLLCPIAPVRCPHFPQELRGLRDPTEGDPPLYPWQHHLRCRHNSLRRSLKYTVIEPACCRVPHGQHQWHAP